jgi:hypothetical protein
VELRIIPYGNARIHLDGSLTCQVMMLILFLKRLEKKQKWILILRITISFLILIFPIPNVGFCWLERCSKRPTRIGYHQMYWIVI